MVSYSHYGDDGHATDIPIQTICAAYKYIYIIRQLLRPLPPLRICGVAHKREVAPA